MQISAVNHFTASCGAYNSTILLYRFRSGNFSSNGAAGRVRRDEKKTGEPQEGLFRHQQFNISFLPGA